MGSRKGSDFAGVGVAIVTPFKEGKLDVKRLQEQIDFQIKSGVTFLVPVGTTGESPTLSYDEHNQVIEICTKIAKKNLKVIAGTGSNSTEEAIIMTKHAKKAGADSCLIVTPYYNKPNQEGIYQHFKELNKCNIQSV